MRRTEYDALAFFETTRILPDLTTKLTIKLAKKPTGRAPKVDASDVPPDRDETVSEMEPLLISEGSRHRPRLNELVFELVSAAISFKTSLPDGMVAALSDLVRSMNCL